MAVERVELLPARDHDALLAGIVVDVCWVSDKKLLSPAMISLPYVLSLINMPKHLYFQVVISLDRDSVRAL